MSTQGWMLVLMKKKLDCSRVVVQQEILQSWFISGVRGQCIGIDWICFCSVDGENMCIKILSSHQYRLVRNVTFQTRSKIEGDMLDLRNSTDVHMHGDVLLRHTQNIGGGNIECDKWPVSLLSAIVTEATINRQKFMDDLRITHSPPVIVMDEPLRCVVYVMSRYLSVRCLVGNTCSIK